MKKLMSKVNGNKKLLYTLGILLLMLTMASGHAVASILTGQSDQETSDNAKHPIENIKVLGSLTITRQHVMTDTGGIVKQVLIEEGSSVKSGQVLAVLENLELSTELYKAQAALDVAKAKQKQLLDGSSLSKVAAMEAKVRAAQHALAGFREASDELRSLVSKIKLDQTALSDEAGEEIRRLEKILKEHSKHLADPQSAANQGDHSSHHSSTSSKGAGDGKMGEDCAVLLQHLQDLHGIVSNLDMDQKKQSLIKDKETKINLEVTIRQLEKQLAELLHQTELAREQVKEAEAELADAKAGPSQADQELAHAQVKQAEVDLELAKINLEKTKVTVHYPGYITDVEVKPGDIVISGAPLFALEKPYEAWFEVNISKDKAGTLKRGQTVEFTVEGIPDQTFTGNIYSFQLQLNGDNNLLNTSSAIYKVKVKANNAKGTLKDGMEVNYLMI